MKKILYKFLLWIASAGNQQEQSIDRGDNVDEWKQWHATRIANLEEDLSLIKQHLGIRVVNRGKQVVSGSEVESYGLMTAAQTAAKRATNKPGLKNLL